MGILQPIIVHAKVTIVDDRLLRVGSANLNNRSFGLDTECDCAIEAPPGTLGAGTRRRIRRIRDELVGHFLGSEGNRFAEVAGDGSLVRAIEALDPDGRRLAPIEPGRGVINAAAQIDHTVAGGTRVIGDVTLTGRSSAVRNSLVPIVSACSTAFSNSLALPGLESVIKMRIAALVSRRIGSPCCCANYCKKCWTRSGISSRLSFRSGSRTGTTLRR